MHCVDIFVYFQLIVKHAQESFPWLGLFCQSISLQALSISIGYLMDVMFLILFNLWGVHYKFFFRFRRLVAHFCGNLYPELRPSWAEHLARLTAKHRCLYPVISSCLTCLLSRFWHENFTRPETVMQSLHPLFQIASNALHLSYRSLQMLYKLFQTVYRQVTNAFQRYEHFLLLKII